VTIALLFCQHHFFLSSCIVQQTVHRDAEAIYEKPPEITRRRRVSSTKTFPFE
jgi:hypothetical protein